MKLFLILSLFFFYPIHSNDVIPEKIHYALSVEPIDVVIPCVGKDLDTLNRCIEGIKRFGKNIRRIIVVSSKKLTSKAEWFDEKNYPFSKNDVAFSIFQDEQQAKQYLSSKKNRIGWIYQQLLKLYAPFVIPGISSNVLILDSDTIFLKPIEFLDSMGGGLYNVGVEYHLPYFSHMKRLIFWMERLYPEFSGVTHHMLFQKAVLDDLFDHIESYHQMEAWKALCHCIDHQELFGSSLSEYEIYFNFVFARTDQVHIRPLKWENISSLDQVKNFKRQGYSYVSCHAYYRDL